MFNHEMHADITIKITLLKCYTAVVNSNSQSTHAEHHFHSFKSSCDLKMGQDHTNLTTYSSKPRGTYRNDRNLAN